MKGKKANLTGWFSWQRILLVAASIPASLAGSWVLCHILVPDPCRYHQGKYLGDAELPMWIRVFFPPVDAMQHPEPNVLYFLVCVALGGVLTLCAIHITCRLRQHKGMQQDGRSLESRNRTGGEPLQKKIVSRGALPYRNKHNG